MALNLTRPTAYGDAVKAKYHRIVHVAHVLTEGRAAVTVAGYASEADRRADAAPLTQNVVTIEGDAYTAGMDLGALYAALKAGPFSGAKDV